jgi:hypothetical protein
VDYYRFLAFFDGIRHADDLPLAPRMTCAAGRKPRPRARAS